MKTRKKIGFALILLSLTMLLTGCTTAWIGEADNIIVALLPAIQAILGLVLAFGAEIPAEVQSAITTGGNEVLNDLNKVIKPLLDQYEQAATTALKQDILSKIQLAIQVALNNWSGILGAVHIKDAALQTKIVAILSLVETELTDLVSVVPVLQGTASIHDKNVHLPLTADQFTRQFNRLMNLPPQPRA